MHLRARIALSLAPPDDVARSTDGLTCTRANCCALRSFLADPVATTWPLKAAAPQRAHVEESIGRAHCDADFRTERRGARTLVCNRNQASYQARVRQRAAEGVVLVGRTVAALGGDDGRRYGHAILAGAGGDGDAGTVVGVEAKPDDARPVSDLEETVRAAALGVSINPPRRADARCPPL